MSVSPLYHFIFSPRLRLARHVLFWGVYLLVWSVFWTTVFPSFAISMFITSWWLPVKILYAYPLIYYVVPQVLLKGRYLLFACIAVIWGIAGWFINFLTMAFVILPVENRYLGWNVSTIDPWMPATYLCLLVAAASLVIIKIIQYWIQREREWMDAKNQKVTAELQLLKAQVHPHFLFNTLNSIYAFSLERSTKTPGLVLKLSSLLSYMLYDCKSDEVLLEKEMEIMKNYIDLEKERYGHRIEISMNMEGDLHNQWVAPFLLLPFIENAFKHGTSEQLDKVWLSVDIAVKNNQLFCKIVNSKNHIAAASTAGIGIENVRKRLSLLYAGRHELKLSDEGDFFVVSLHLHLAAQSPIQLTTTPGLTPAYQMHPHEMAMFNSR